MTNKEVPQGFHLHPNGGGLVQDTCIVDSSVYVGPNARVSGNAQTMIRRMIHGLKQINQWADVEAANAN